MTRHLVADLAAAQDIGAYDVLCNEPALYYELDDIRFLNLKELIGYLNPDPPWHYDRAGEVELVVFTVQG